MNVEKWKFSEHAASLVASLKACTKQKDLQNGARIHSYLLERGLLEKDVYLGNALIHLYAKCGILTKAQEVFNDLPFRNVVSWTSLISGYTQHGRYEEALELFSRMERCENLSPDSFMFACIINACGKLGRLDKGEDIHAMIVREGLIEKDTFLGNALIDMYAKCGALVKARQIFDEIQVRDVVSWTTLINGYAECGHVEKSLICYEEMEHEGFCPNEITYVCILKACASIGALDKGRKVHDEIVREGFLEKSILLGVALVDMYARCGTLEKAQQVFDRLPFRDVVIWNALIGGYVHKGHGEEALAYFTRMQCEGRVPDAITFLCVFNACGGLGAIGRGKEMHTQILSEGLQCTNASIGNALIDMYAKCDVLSNAQEVFDQLQTRNVIAWNTLIGAYAQYGQGDKALDHVKRMHQESLLANPVTYLMCLKAIGSMGAVNKGMQVHVGIVKADYIEEDRMLSNALVGMYAKCGALANAKYAFDHLLDRDVVSWSSMIGGYAQQGHGEKALDYYGRMKCEGISPNAITFVYILKACASIGASDHGEEIHADIVRTGLFKDNRHIGNALIDMYAKCGELVKAQKVFDQLTTPDIVSWSALIAGYAQHGHSEEALNCFDEVRRKSLTPDAIAFVWVLKACSNVKASSKGEEIHDEIVREGLLAKDSFIGTALVDMYANCGLLAKARGVFNQLQMQDVVSWSALIAGYAQYGDGEEALKCYDQMQHEGISPNEVTFICILEACSNLGAIDKAKEMHAEIDRQGLLARNILVGNALLEMYAKCGLHSRAQEVFDQLRIRDVVTWNTLIASYAQLGDNNTVFELFNEMMQQDDIQPNPVTFTILLNACSHSGELGKGEICFQAMSMEYDIIPNMEHYTCMVDLFGRGGHVEKAIEIIKRMPSADYLPVWVTLLSACCKLGDVKLGRLAFEYAIQLDENHAGIYVCMRNIYASAPL